MILLNFLVLFTFKNIFADETNFSLYASWNSTNYIVEEQIIECENCFPSGLKFSYNGDAFIIFPRDKDLNYNNSITLGYLKKGGDNNTIYPFPDYAKNDVNNCLNDSDNNLCSITGIEIDVENENGKLYVLDQGTIHNNFTYETKMKLWIFNLNNLTDIEKIVISNNLVFPGYSYLSNLVILNEENTHFAFITDRGSLYNIELKEGIFPGIIVVDIISHNYSRILDGNITVLPDSTYWLNIQREKVYKDKPLYRGVDSIALSCDRYSLFYSPLSSQKIYSLELSKVLSLVRLYPNQSLSSNSSYGLKEGYKLESTSAMLSTNGKNLYFVGLETESIYLVNEIEADLLRLNYKEFQNFYDISLNLYWIYSLSLYQSNLYFLAYNHNINENSTSDFKYAIFSMPANENEKTYFSKCSDLKSNTNAQQIVIWILLAVVILIVLSFVLMGSNNQEEVMDKHMNIGLNKDD